MVKLEDGKIYEFIENKYGELKERDKGYYPSKHDDEVFRDASIKFGLPIEELNKIFNGFQTVATKKEMEKLEKLPEPLREKKRLEMIKDILKNNKDLPFCKAEGEPVNPIKSGHLVINEEYIELVKRIGENGWTIPMTMGLSDFEKLFDVSASDDNNIYDNFFDEFYKPKNFNQMIKHINNSPIIDTQKQLFKDCIDAYESEKYLLCINSLIPMIEGILSQFDEDKTNTRMMKVCKKNVDETKNQSRLITNLIWVSFYSFVSILYKQSNFADNEPVVLNRHWILHGRAEREYRKEDCLRLINALYTIVSILRCEKS